ncbi:MAG: hypothetical protein HOG80_05975 [Candidatus Marinimicrobia bacterium]|jgi:hypothetical protein|nr:hypothetical protein [Candidatus Neomarinimicrobiota bacterium]
MTRTLFILGGDVIHETAYYGDCSTIRVMELCAIAFRVVRVLFAGTEQHIYLGWYRGV